MSKSELVSSASRDGNNGTEESETSDDFTLYFKRVRERKLPRKRIIRFRKTEAGRPEVSGLQLY